MRNDRHLALTTAVLMSMEESTVLIVSKYCWPSVSNNLKVCGMTSIDRVVLVTTFVVQMSILVLPSFSSHSMFFAEGKKSSSASS